MTTYLVGELPEGVHDSGVAPVEGGASSAASCLVRVMNCLRSFWKADLSIDQSDGQIGLTSSPKEFALVRGSDDVKNCR